jgi:hypothetical protein
VRLLQRRLGYGTVGGLLAWLAVIAAFVAFAILMAWGVADLEAAGERVDERLGRRLPETWSRAP